MSSRVRRIFRSVGDGVDLIVFANSTDPHVDVSFMYATGLTDGLFEGCAAFCYPDGGAEIATSALEEEAAKKSGVPLHRFFTREERETQYRKLLKGHRRIGLNFSEITHKAAEELWKFAPKAKFVDVSQAVMKARLVKEPDEIGSLRKAARVASRAFEDIVEDIRPGRQESSVAADLVYAMQRRGAWVPLRDKGETIGAVLRTRAGTRPIYVSIGHRVSLAEHHARRLAWKGEALAAV